MSEQKQWIERARETYRFHRSKILEKEKHTVARTAYLLRRSYGSVVEDLLIARWLRTHEKQIEKFEHAFQALEFIREKKKMQEIGED